MLASIVQHTFAFLFAMERSFLGSLRGAYILSMVDIWQYWEL